MTTKTGKLILTLERARAAYHATDPLERARYRGEVCIACDSVEIVAWSRLDGVTVAACAAHVWETLNEEG